MTARPELVALALAAALAAAASRPLRHRAVVASAAGLATIALVVGMLRPPLSTQTLALLAGAGAMGCATAASLVLAGRLSRRAGVGVLASAAALLAAGIATVGAWRTLAGSDWVLLVLAVAGLAAAAGSNALRTRSLRILALTVPLALVYWWKNPDSVRYAALLLPSLAVVAGLGLGRVRPVLLAGAAALALACALQGSVPSVGPDAFPGIASRLEHAPPGPLVTAAPDAYGALLPYRAVRVMRPGATGLVVVDGPARLYEPGLRVAGRLLATIPAGPGFLRPDGSVDDEPVLLYRGTVTRARR